MNPQVDIADLVFGRVIFVTGKGGAGKTSVAAAIAQLAAAQGRRTLLAEVDTQHSALTQIFGRSPTYQPVEVAPRLSICNVDWLNALHEWVEVSVPSKRVVDMILDNRIVRVFLDATPGNREVVTLSRICVLSRQFDLVVVDLPASGHAAALMATPMRTMTLFKVGPLFTRSRESQDLLEDPGTAMVLVALPEEMVVNETVETWQKLRRDVPGLRVPMVVLNRAARPSLSEDERELLRRLSAQHAAGPEGELLLAGRWEASLETATGEAMERFRDELGIKLVDIPRLSTEAGVARLVHNLAAALARSSQRALQRSPA